jgi:predicted amidophosphoribosyltransferase
MHLWKYQGVTEAGAVLGDAFAAFAEEQREFLGGTSPVPIAAHPWRLWQRGFNQAETLAAAVGEATGQAAALALGKRFRWRSQVQTGTAAGARAKNVRDVFYLTQKPPQRAVLVDDAVTTGSTLAAAARVLRAGGTAEVGAVTFLSARRRSGRS